MIDDLYQAGTDQALDDRVARAKPVPKAEPGGVSFWNLVQSGPRGFGAGVSRYIAGQADIVGAFGQVLGAYPEAIGVQPSPEQADQAAAQRTKLLKDGINFTDPAGDVFRARAADLMPDPVTAHWSEQVVGGFGSLFGTLGGSILGAGPLAPVAFGLSEGLGEADKLKAQGVDLATRTKAATVYGAVQGATIVAPVIGRGALETVGLVAAAGPGSFMASNAAEQTILKHAGYDKIAGQYDPFDPWGLAAATLFPGTIAGGVHALRVIRAPAKPIAAPKNEADMRTAVALNPAEQAASDAFERSAGNLRELDAAIAKEKNPANRAILVAERQRLADEPAAAAAVAADPELVDAARVRHQAAVVDAYRLTADGDVVGMNAHVDALAKATDQLSNGEPVNVASLIEIPEAEINARIPDIPSFERYAVSELEGFAMGREAKAPRDEFLAFLRQSGGVAIEHMLDITGERGVRANRGAIFKRSGQQLDELVQSAIEVGYLSPDVLTVANDIGGTRALSELIRRATAGERIKPFADGFASRAAAAGEDARTQHAEKRLKQLGIDPAPARGNADIMERYLADHGLDIANRSIGRDHAFNVWRAEIEAAVDEMRRAEPAVSEPPAPRQERPPSAYRAAVDELAPTLIGKQPGQAAAELKQAGKLTPLANNTLVGLVEAGGDPARISNLVRHAESLAKQTPGRAPGDVMATAVDRMRAGEVAPQPEAPKVGVESLMPDLPVRVADDGRIVSAKAELEQVRREAMEGTVDTLGADHAALFEVAANCFLTGG